MNNVGSVGNVGTLPLVLRRDELAGRIFREMNNPHAFFALDKGPKLPNEKVPLIIQNKAFKATARRLSESVVVVWRGDLFDAACYQADLFWGTKMPVSLLPTVPQWWPSDVLARTSKAWKIQMDSAKEVGPDCRFQGLLVVPLPDGEAYDVNDKGEISLTASGPTLNLQAISTWRGVPGIVTVSTPVGETLRDHPLIRNIVAALTFMEQEFVDKKTTRYPARFSAFRQKYVPLVNQVVLRARHVDVVPGSEADCERHREYEHSWTVRGHWRKLHEPRKADGQQVVWVRPHIKGDPEKPLLPPRETIVKVCR